MSEAALDLRRLRYFAAVARLGSMTAAARTLGVAQPALSVHVARLEEAYGVRLFERLSRGVAMTAAGEALQAHAEVILRELALADADLREAGWAAALPAALRVGLVASLAEVVTPRLIAALAQSFPGVRPQVMTADAGRCLSLVDAGQLEIAGTVQSRGRLDGDVIAANRLCLVSRPEPGAVLAPQIAFAELAEMRLILPPAKDGLRELIDRAAAQAGVRLNDVVRVGGLGPRKESVIAGLGATILPAVNVVRELAAGLLAKQDIVAPQISRVVVFRARAGLDRRFAARLRHIVAAALEAAEDAA